MGACSRTCRSGIRRSRAGCVRPQPEGHGSRSSGLMAAVNEQSEENLRTRSRASASSPRWRPPRGRESLTPVHGERRAWVWARLGMAPLAQALGHLVDLADRCARDARRRIGRRHRRPRTRRRDGRRTGAAIEALAAVEPGPDGDAVGVAVVRSTSVARRGRRGRCRGPFANEVPAEPRTTTRRAPACSSSMGCASTSRRWSRRRSGRRRGRTSVGGSLLIPTVTPHREAGGLAGRPTGSAAGPKLSPSATRRRGRPSRSTVSARSSTGRAGRSSRTADGATRPAALDRGRRYRQAGPQPADEAAASRPERGSRRSPSRSASCWRGAGSASSS